MLNWYICLVLILYNDLIWLQATGDVIDLLLDCFVFIGTVRKEDRPNISTLNISELCSVFFLLLQCLLVLLDQVLLVVRYRASTDEAELLFTTHALGVDVVPCLRIFL